MFGLFRVVPNVVPFVLAYGVLSLFTKIVTFSHTVAILIAIGLVVDATIHFLTKFKKANVMNLSSYDAIQYCYK